MAFVISTQHIPGSKKFADIYIKGHCYRSAQSLFVFKGEAYNCQVGELFYRIGQQGIRVVSEINGEYSLAYYNSASRRIWLANSRFGRETVYYFWRREYFIISDDFWEIVNLIEPNTSAIDAQSVREWAIFSKPLFYKTIIKDLNIFAPASIGTFSLRDFTFDITKYWDFRYEPNEELTIDEAVERLDYLFDNAVKRIKEGNSPKAVYGIGLSGGLDSRLIPYYALKHNMKLRSFNIGEKRPHKFIRSRDHSSAQQLAKYYNLEHSEVEYDSESFEVKSFYNVRYAPMINSEFFVTVPHRVPEFDILLTGIFGGELFGHTVPPDDLMELSESELMQAIVSRWSFRYLYKLRSPIKFVPGRLMKLLFNLDVGEGRQLICIDGIMNGNQLKEAFEEAKSKVNQFIKENRDKSNLNIWQEYVLFHHWQRTRNTSWASLNGTRKSYSVYLDYHIIEESLTWKAEFLINRNLQEQFCIRKLPGLAKIALQGNEPPLIFYRKQEPSALRKTLHSVANIVRGGGLRYTDWAQDKRYKEYSRKILLRENKIFDAIFDVEGIMKLGREKTRLYEHLVKIKQVLDLIETKGYRYFLNSNDKEMT